MLQVVVRDILSEMDEEKLALKDRVILQENTFNFKLYGNEVYYTHTSLFLMKIMLLSELHCQKVLN